MAFRTKSLALVSGANTLVLSAEFDTLEVVLVVSGAASVFAQSSAALTASDGFPLADGVPSPILVLMPGETLYVKAAGTATSHIAVSQSL